MDRWNERAYPGIVALAVKDAVYLELMAENKLLEPEYLKIMDKLGEQDREILDRYVASCESIEFRLAQLAYWYGNAHKN